MKATFLDENNHNELCNKYKIFELQYEAVAELFFSCFRLLLLLCNGSWIRAGSLKQHGQEN